MRAGIVNAVTPQMIIDLRRLEEGSGRLRETETVVVEDAFGEERHVRCVVDIDYNLSAASAHLHVVVDGRFATSCHRCLERVDEPISCEFDVAVRRGAESVADDADLEYMTIGPMEHEIDIGPVLQENVVVDVPMIILCKEDCRGLCPSCGNNRNQDSCKCEEAADPRWDALRKLGRDE